LKKPQDSDFIPVPFLNMRARFFPLCLLGLLPFATAHAGKFAATFAGVPLAPGSTVRADVPLNAQEKSLVSAGGNTPPTHAVAVIAVPENFRPDQTWPVLVVLSTSDGKTQNRDDLVQLYRKTALAEGWIALAGDGPTPALHDTAGWRAGMTLAALDALHASFPGSQRWPIACAGYSGGSKRTGTIAPLLARQGNHVVGLFLTGINEDHLSEGYQRYRPGTEFLQTPIFISSGTRDRVARPASSLAARDSMRRTGFARIRLENFPFGHVVKASHVAEALRWFRSLLKS
jgi:hypothetical protein